MIGGSVVDRSGQIVGNPLTGKPVDLLTSRGSPEHRHDWAWTARLAVLPAIAPRAPVRSAR